MREGLVGLDIVAVTVLTSDYSRTLHILVTHCRELHVKLSKIIGSSKLKPCIIL